MEILHAIIATFTRQALRQTSDSYHHHDQQSSQTILYLFLGALLGIFYSLAISKYIRIIQHPHLFIRNTIMWLSAIIWVLFAFAVTWLTSRIFNQGNETLESFDRILGVLIPFIIRADLIIDWVRRVTYTLLNINNYTQSVVQARRLLTRTIHMSNHLEVNIQVKRNVYPILHTTTSSLSCKQDRIDSENNIWIQDPYSPIHKIHLIQHFQKLVRIAMYAIATLLGAIPAAVVWIFYALIQAIISISKHAWLSGAMYLSSILFAPVGAAIAVIASTVIFCGVVSFSILGTVILYILHWSVRTIFTMIRIILSQAWAGFPDLTRPKSMPQVQMRLPGPNAAQYAVKAVRQPEEAGAAIARMGDCLPAELEFALASWDGSIPYHDKAADGWRSQDFSLSSCLEWLWNRQRYRRENVTRKDNIVGTNGYDTNSRTSLADTIDGEDEDNSAAFNSVDSRRLKALETALVEQRRLVRQNEMTMMLLGRLGLDLSVNNAKGRRLSTYYALAMLTNMQVESHGTAFRLKKLCDRINSEFETRIEKYDSLVALEATDSLNELATRLYKLTKYKLIPCGDPLNRMIPVSEWLKTILLLFLETPANNSDNSDRRSRLSSFVLQ